METESRLQTYIGLTNSYCLPYGNAFFQVLFHSNGFSNIIYTDTDQSIQQNMHFNLLSAFYRQYETATAPFSAYEYYSEIKKQNPLPMDNLYKFIKYICTNNPLLSKICGISYENGNESINFVLTFDIENIKDTVQKSLRSYDDLDDIKDTVLNHLFIFFNRNSDDQDDRTQIQINEYVTINDSVLKLHGIIYHRGKKKGMSYCSILKSDNEIYYINNERVFNAMQNGTSQRSIEQSVIFLSYLRVTDYPENYQDLIFIPSKNVTNSAATEEGEQTITTAPEIIQQTTLNFTEPTGRRSSTIPTDQLFALDDQATDDDNDGVPLREMYPENAQQEEQIDEEDHSYELYVTGDNIGRSIIPTYETTEFEDPSTQEYKAPRLHGTEHHVTNYDIHSDYKYLHGYLRIVNGEKPKEYNGRVPKYQPHADLLKAFQMELGKLKFNYTITTGEQNAEITATKYNLTSILPTVDQVKDAGNALFAEYEKYISKFEQRGEFPTEEKISKKIKEILNPLLITQPPRTDQHTQNQGNAQQLVQNQSTHPMHTRSQVQTGEQRSDNDQTIPSPQEREIHYQSEQTTQQGPAQQREETPIDNIIEYLEDNDGNRAFLRLDSRYNWRERMLEISQSVIEQLANLGNQSDDEQEGEEEESHEYKRETIYQNEKNKLNRKLWKDFITNRLNHISISDFAEKWAQERARAIVDGELKYSPKTIMKLIRQWQKTDGPNDVKTKGGGLKKITDDTIKCLITTVLDFPEATDLERCEYINKYGRCTNGTIGKSTVNRILKNLSVTIKEPSFAPPARNSLGYRIARVIWAKVMDSLKSKDNLLLVFVDEAGVILEKRRKARGFVSITPCMTKSSYRKNISILSAVIPSYGTISRWYSRGVRGHDYAKFLREITRIIRINICNQETDIVIINDNASIHRTNDVKEMAQKCGLNLFYTIPYSPQTNLLAENYFSQMKVVAATRFKSIENEITTGTSPIQHNFIPYKQFIMKQWMKETKEYYTPEKTRNVFGAWIRVLIDCMEGKSLHGDHIDAVDTRVFDHETLYFSSMPCLRVKDTYVD